jgi:hypothetical protein
VGRLLTPWQVDEGGQRVYAVHWGSAESGSAVRLLLSRSLLLWGLWERMQESGSNPARFAATVSGYWWLVEPRPRKSPTDGI